MKTVIYAAFFMAAVSLNFCKTDSKQTAANTGKAPAADSSLELGQSILSPPDPDYTGDFYKKYPNGITQVRGFFRFGKKHGSWMYFRENGLKWSEAYFENDKMNGESNVYHENGKLYYSGFYKMDKPVGTWSFYDSTGTLVTTKKYDDYQPGKNQEEKKK